MILSTRFQDALTYAAELHKEQLRKGSDVPYVAHLLAVASIALQQGASENEAIAALLHDAVEDQGGAATREEIRKRFGEEVALIVDGCTDTDVTPKPPWRQRKEAYIRHVRDASESVRLVSASDKVDNARAILRDYRQHGEQVWDRFKGGKAGILWYYRSLIEAFTAAGTNPLVEELDRIVSEIERMAAAPNDL